MIASLYGYIAAFSGNYIVLNVNDVGYKIFCSLRILNNVNILCRQKIKIAIETVVKDEQTVLIGFLSHTERQIFNKLITIQSIGSKTALSILSCLSNEQIINAINTQDYKIFTIADGVGPKAADRIVRELKGKNLLEMNYRVIENGKIMDSYCENVSDNSYIKNDGNDCKSQNIFLNDDLKVDEGENKIVNKSEIVNKNENKIVNKSENLDFVSEDLPSTNNYIQQNDMIFECISALTNLGYVKYDATNVVTFVMRENECKNFDELFRLSIKKISK